MLEGDGIFIGMIILAEIMEISRYQACGYHPGQDGLASFVSKYSSSVHKYVGDRRSEVKHIDPNLDRE